MIEGFELIIKRAARGDSEAFAILLREKQSLVYNLAYRLSENREDALDISQEVFIKVWRSLPGFRGDSSFDTWLYRITLNAARDYLERERKHTRGKVDEEDTPESLTASYDTPEERYLDLEEAGEVKAALGRLSREHREILILREVHGYGYREIADMLDLEEGTVKSRINRARAALKKELTEWNKIT
ncbi:MAG: sigma-70 family RNA polymerase sigma factor [Clostridia bacterium]|nr:sigma-70 family RNA polymerase sigma factor [Clostridia bacterium]